MARPLGFVAVAIGYGALQAAIVVAETDLQHRIEGRARATVTSVSGLLSELGAIGLYAFVALDDLWQCAQLRPGESVGFRHVAG